MKKELKYSKSKVKSASVVQLTAWGGVVSQKGERPKVSWSFTNLPVSFFTNRLISVVLACFSVIRRSSVTQRVYSTISRVLGLSGWILQVVQQRTRSIPPSPCATRARSRLIKESTFGRASSEHFAFMLAFIWRLSGEKSGRWGSSAGDVSLQ